MRSIVQKFWPILVIATILIIVNINQIINNQSLMIFNTDSYAQSLQFYLGGWEKLRNFDFSLWDWTSGYGTNYFNHVYYFATSPFFMITLFFNKDFIPFLFLYLNAFKMFLLFLFSYLWLSKLVKERWIITIGALIITFSGWVTFLYHYNLFLDGFVLYPLILYSIETFYRRKSYLFVFLVGLLGIINYYLLYMFIPFIVIYSIMRFFVIRDDKSFKSFALDMVPLALLGFIGIGLSSIILLPSLQIIIGMPRLSTELNLFEHVDFYSIYRYISTLFSPTVKWDNPTYFISVSFDSGYGWGGGISVFSFYLFILLIPGIFLIQDKKIKITTLITYGILLFMSYFTVFYRIFQGTLDVRWFYMFLFMNVYAIVHILQDMSQHDYSKRFVLISWIISTSLIISLYFISFIKGFANSEDLDLLKIIVMYGIFCLTSYAILLYFRKLKYILIIVIIEAIVSFLLPLYTYPPIDSESFNKQYSSELKSSQAVEYIESMDDSFYRIIRNGLGAYSLNEPFSNQYKGITFYESLYNFNTSDFISRFTNDWLLPYTHGRFNTNFLLSTKYYIQENEISSVPYGFDYLTTINNDKIYINRYFISLGFSTSTTINEDYFKTLSIYDQDQLWLNTIVIKESTNTEPHYISSREIISSTGDNGYLYLTDVDNFRNSIITIENNGTPYLTINKHYGENIITEFHYQYDYYQMYITSDDNFDVFELSAINPYGDINNVNVFITKDLSVYDKWYENLNTFENIVIKQDYVSADINIKQDHEWVTTSIPYDTGWTVLVDGEKFGFEKVNLGFIGLNLNSGYHHIEFKYEPPFFKLGLIVSGISLFVYLVLIICKYKCHKKVNKL